VRKGKVDRAQWPEIVRRRATGETFAGIGRDYGCSAPAMRYIVRQFQRLSVPPRRMTTTRPPALPPPSAQYAAASGAELRTARAPDALQPSADNDLAGARYAATEVARFLGAIDATLNDRSPQNLISLLAATEQLMFMAAKIHQGATSLLGQQG
jgi:hypothetical protein